jgi:hypothetical protein
MTKLGQAAPKRFNAACGYTKSRAGPEPLLAWTVSKIRRAAEVRNGTSERWAYACCCHDQVSKEQILTIRGQIPYKDKDTGHRARTSRQWGLSGTAKLGESRCPGAAERVAPMRT